MNPPIHHFCSTCGRPLTREVEMELDDLKGEIRSDSDYQQMYEELMARMEAIEGRITL